MESILNSHSVATLKGEIRKNNVKGYSGKKKADIIKLMIEHKEKFSYIKMSEKKERKKPVKKEKKEEPVKKENPVKKEKKEIKPLLDYERLSTNNQPRTIEQKVAIRKMSKQRKNQALKIVKKEKREKEKQEKENK